MTAEARAGLTLLLAALWFGALADPAARALEEQRAGQLRTAGAAEAVERVLSLASRAPEAMPQGEERARCYALLEEALALEQVTLRWSEGALALLSPEQRAVVAAQARRPPMPRSRAWPRTPTELLYIVQTLSDRHGTSLGQPPPLPEEDPMPGTPPLDRLRGLAALVELNEPPLTASQAEALQLAALEGIRAHEEGWARASALIDALGADAVDPHRPPGAARGDPGRSAQALAALRP